MSAGFEHKLIARFSRSSCFLWPCTLLSNMLETFSVLNTGRAVTFRQLYSNSRANKKVIKHFLISCGPPCKSKNVISFESASKFISNESEICNTFSLTAKLFTFFDWVENYVHKTIGKVIIMNYNFGILHIQNLCNCPWQVPSINRASMNKYCNALEIWTRQKSLCFSYSLWWKNNVV